MNELKYELEGAFECFLDEHKEYLEGHEDEQLSLHKPKYEGIDTTADEEFNVYCAIRDLSEKELHFLYALMSEKVLFALIYNTRIEEETKGEGGKANE